MSASPNGRWPIRVAAALLLCMTGGADATESLAEAGRLLYRDGVGWRGAPVAATVQGDVAVTGATLACVSCHKRSGLGASEGGRRAPAVTAPALFQSPAPEPAAPGGARPVYTDETLVRAITAGIASDGRVLSPLMPRYRLGPEDARALVEYLHALGAAPPPGVSATEIELATIVSAGAPASEREAVTAVVSRFAETINGGTRQEQRRATASRRHPYGERHARTFRQWNLSTWTLEGPVAGWPAQLEKLYAERSPFAVISGTVGADWPVVHAFCERRELPCILPVTELPVEAASGHYTIYYSAGVRLEARVTARSIAGDGDAGGRILVLYADDALGKAALEAFADALPETQRSRLQTVAIAPGATPTRREWSERIRLSKPQSLVAWLQPQQLQALASIPSGAVSLPARIYTAAAFTDWGALRAPPAFEQRVLHVYPYNRTADGLAQFPREDTWLKQRGLEALDRIPAAEALFASHVSGEAMTAMADNYSRDYFIETLEHMLDGTAMTTVYPRTTLGTGQRFLAKGAFVLRLAPAGAATRYATSEWIQP